MDYTFLLQEGVRALEQMTGGQWTDFNAHDPGITILEQLCYALSDLSYRTAFEIPDLLADGGGNPYDSLHPPAEILASCTVTQADLRKVVLDVHGVKNAWVQPLEDVTLYYDPRDKDLHFTPRPLASESVDLKGLYNILLESEDPHEGLGVMANIIRRLHGSRGLCEDLEETTLLETLSIQVDATVELEAVDDDGRVGKEIIRRIADVIAPRVQFETLKEILDREGSLHEVFDGPQLGRGALSDEALEAAARRTAINTSDLIHAIMDVAGVRAVSRILLYGAELWSVAVASDKVARLDLEHSMLTLRREGKIRRSATMHTYVGVQATSVVSSDAPGADVGSLPLPVGRNRNVASYTSVQRHLPELYGVGDLGLPDSATPERKAEAKQLAAYLMFFDQLMADHLAQLAHAKDLFSYDGPDLRTYFGEEFKQPDPPVSTKPVPSERKTRFLNHLLARFAETIDAHDTYNASAVRRLARCKQRFLRRAPQLGGARGKAFNYLKRVRSTNRSGIEQRLRLELGLRGRETFVIVEHILLRPMKDEEQRNIPLLAAALQKDPYSLQLTFVFPGHVGRFKVDDDHVDDGNHFRRVVEQTIRAETPAHLTPYVSWRTKDDWAIFRAAHKVWLKSLRVYSKRKLVVVGPAPNPAPLRAARDRLIDLLGFGVVRPDPGLAVSVVGSPLVDPTIQFNIRIAGSQEHVTYSAYIRALVDEDFEFEASSARDVIAIDVPAVLDLPARTVRVHRPPWSANWEERDDLAAEPALGDGNGGDLELTLGPVKNDSIVVIRAHKKNQDPKYDVQLEQTMVILPRPGRPPDVPLALTLQPGGTTMLVSRGQPGVFYHFRRSDQNTEVALPAYFHRPGVGISRLRVKMDLVVTREPLATELVVVTDPPTPPDPLIEVPPLAGEDGLSVTAVWARTGVAWEEPITVTIDDPTRERITP